MSGGVSGCGGGWLIIDSLSAGVVAVVDSFSVGAVGVADVAGATGTVEALCVIALGMVVTGVGRVVNGALATTGWYRRRNFLFLRVTLPEPSTLTTYWSN